ncbi:MAG: cytochrome c [Cytophagaceae bacterium]|nr:cytochrome c [Gemmatimonadaceae bacterium]
MVGVPATASSQASLTGQELYTAACQSCHAPDGRGLPQVHVGFPDAIPDFTDCSYASREAALDWETVVRSGGPSRRFSQRMPAFGGALSPDEIARVVAYIRTLCTESSWPRGEMNLPRATFTEKAFPEDEVVLNGEWVGTGGSRVGTSTLIVEKRVGSRTQWELQLPISVREMPVGSPANWTGVQMGDVSLAIKRTVAHSQSAILSLGGEITLPTGDRTRGFGDGTVKYEPFMLAAVAGPANTFVQVHAGAEIPFRRNVAFTERFARGAVGTTIFIGGRAFSPIAEGLFWKTTRPGAPTNLDWIPQMQVSLSRRQHILGSVGYRMPLTNRDTRSRSLVAYIIWDWFDGPLLGGW